MPLSSVTEVLGSHCSARNTREESGHPPCVHRVAEAERERDGGKGMGPGSQREAAD